ncbi:hypothetical protein NNC19_15685 [Clostridium sp. SHJSY1]|uniref:hypothetical protein n=1 Tax=Clostridium sp. SHJSY1 TaxID=2942483 RepID=UPI002874DC2A|nr:hypothetical protein [Clostridium sp. SHJSY1]MDS0527132.1 hypothetical protein [Clostridium sp. SHJSY1]
MAERYTKEYSQSLVNGYIEDIEKQKKNILQSLKDMDFENNQVRDEFEHIVNKLIGNCNRLIEDIMNHSNFE